MIIGAQRQFLSLSSEAFTRNASGLPFSERQIWIYMLIQWASFVSRLKHVYSIYADMYTPVGDTDL